jgi:hypothetical protein
MAKKSRRVRRKGTQPRLSKAQLVQPVQTAQETRPIEEEVPVQQAERLTATDFQTEYHYVARDLQRIGFLAAAMLAGLVILAFVL